MSGKYFLDTNIIIYSFDKSERRKLGISQKLIREALENNLGIVSYQVVQEFINVAINKFAKPLSTLDTKEYLNNVLMPLCEIFPNILFYEKSLKIRDETGFSFYDSLIVTAAIEGKCSYLYTEDLQHERIVRNVTIQNPFL